MSRRGGQVCSPSFPLPPRVKHFPAKDALADKIENYAGVSRGRQKKRKANAAKFLQRLIFCSSQTDGLVCVANAYILTLINCDPDACNTDYEMSEGRREVWNYWGQNLTCMCYIWSPLLSVQFRLETIQSDRKTSMVESNTRIWLHFSFTKTIGSLRSDMISVCLSVWCTHVPQEVFWISQN